MCCPLKCVCSKSADLRQDSFYGIGLLVSLGPMRKGLISIGIHILSMGNHHPHHLSEIIAVGQCSLVLFCIASQLDRCMPRTRIMLWIYELAGSQPILCPCSLYWEEQRLEISELGCKIPTKLESLSGDRCRIIGRTSLKNPTNGRKGQ